MYIYLSTQNNFYLIFLCQDGGAGALQVRPRFSHWPPGQQKCRTLSISFTKNKKQNFFIIYIKFAREVYVKYTRIC